jgi:hypothetical protein
LLELDIAESVKATAAWQWWNLLESLVPDGKAVLRLNMDETACRFYYEPAKGIITAEPVAAAVKRGLLAQNVTRKQMRSAVSHVALICDQPGIQPSLPQFILGNEHVLQVRVLDELRQSSSLAKNVTILRDKSSWVTDKKLAKLAREWGRALAPVSEQYQAILLLDACPVHMGKRFLRECARQNIWVCFVPAGLTWLCQPLDTHAFSKYKRCLRDAHHSRALASGEGIVTAKDILLDISLNITRVFNGTQWANSFLGNGFGHQQKAVRQRILEHLRLPEAPVVSSSMPSLLQFEAVFPRKRAVPLADLFACHRRKSSTYVQDAIVSQSPKAEYVDKPWAGRLRSSKGVELSSYGAILPKSSNSIPRQSFSDPPAQSSGCQPAPPRPTASVPAIQRLPRAVRFPPRRRPTPQAPH